MSGEYLTSRRGFVRAPYWIIDAGHKTDYTAKAWAYDRWQAVIDAYPDVWFVQIGQQHKDHVHPKLSGSNLIDLVGQTDMRQLIRLIYNAFGVLTPVSLPMVLSYAIPPHPRYERASRACVVIAGGREGNTWQAPHAAQYLHTVGQLDCCAKGGCWVSRVVPLGNKLAEGSPDPKDKELCKLPVLLPSGQFVPKCMAMIGVDEVVRAVRRYMDNLAYRPSEKSAQAD